MAGEGALTEAVALLRDPSRRHALRGQALPADVGRLLGLLAGSPLKLDTAATEVGVATDELLDAARFYAQEVLLHPAADARRVLGLRPGDDVDVAKRHFRALQAWLHPDRAQGAAEAVFATRVNAAWATCRHDTGSVSATQTDVPPAGQGDALMARMPRWQRLESAPDWLSAQSSVALALVVACAAMLWMAARPTQVPTLPEPTVLASSGRAYEEVANAVNPAVSSRFSRSFAAGHGAPAEHVALPPPEPRPVMVEGETLAQQAKPRPAEPGTVAPLRLPAQQPFPDTPRAGESLAKQSHIKPAPDGRLAIVVMAPAGAEMPTPPAVGSQSSLIDHTEAARQRAQVLLAFLLRKDGAPPPIWRNATALESAEAARAVLTEGAMFRRPHVQETGVRWILVGDEVRVRVPVTPARRGESARTVDVTLQWHDEQWWISALTLEGAP